MEYFNPAWEGLIPGIRSFIATGDTRGKAIGEYAFVIHYDLNHQEKIKNLKGKLKWEGNLEQMRLDQ